MFVVMFCSVSFCKRLCVASNVFQPGTKLEQDVGSLNTSLASTRQLKWTLARRFSSIPCEGILMRKRESLLSGSTLMFW